MTPTDDTAPSLALQLGSTALALALVLLLAWLALRLLKRMQSGRAGVAGAPGIEVLRTTALGPRERLVSVRYRGREYLLGVTAAQVQVIDQWPEGGASVPPLA